MNAMKVLYTTVLILQCSKKSIERLVRNNFFIQLLTFVKVLLKILMKAAFCNNDINCHAFYSIAQALVLLGECTAKFVHLPCSLSHPSGTLMLRN